MEYQGINHTNNLIAEFLKLPILEIHPNGSVTYKLWAPIVPYAEYERYDGSPCIVFKDHSHVYNLLFHSDWNWLMYVVEKIYQVSTEHTVSFAGLSIFELGLGTSLCDLYNAVVEYVIWYKENEHSQN